MDSDTCSGNIQVALPGISDHDIVLVDANIQAIRSKTPRRKIYKWKSANLEELHSEIKTHITTFMSTSFHSVDDMWLAFTNILINAMEKCVPSKLSSTRPTYPWINTEVRRAISRKNKAGRKARKTKNPKDRERYHKMKALAQKTSRQAYNNYIHDIISPEQAENPKRFWSFIKSKKQDNSGVAPLRGQDGLIYSDSKNKSEILNNQFKSAYTQEDKSNLPDLRESTFPSMPQINISEKGVHKLLTDLKIHKAAGPDSIPPRLLKELADVISPALARIFQTSLDAGSVPKDWRTANIVPIFKKGDKSKAANYRPVSLTAICCKKLEHIIYSNIMDHLTQHNILADSQHGFRARRSCETHLVTTIQDLARNLSEGKQIDAILLDFSKAFDKVPHQRLLLKLNHYGIRENTLQWIQHFLQDRTQQVLLGGIHSSTCAVDCCVGSVSSYSGRNTADFGEGMPKLRMRDRKSRTLEPEVTSPEVDWRRPSWMVLVRMRGRNRK